MLERQQRVGRSGLRCTRIHRLELTIDASAPALAFAPERCDSSVAAGGGAGFTIFFGSCPESFDLCLCTFEVRLQYIDRNNANYFIVLFWCKYCTSNEQYYTGNTVGRRLKGIRLQDVKKAYE